MTRSILVLAAAAACAAVPFGAVAQAATANAVINDCLHNGKLTESFTPAQIRHALAVMPANVKQYSNCADVLQTALAGSHVKPGGGTGSGGGGSFLPTPVIVILVLLILAAIGFGGMALRQRRSGAGGGGGSGAPPGG